MNNSIKKMLAAAAIGFASTAAHSATKLTDEQYTVLGTFARVHMIIKDCPYKENTNELSQWSIKAGLTPDLIESEPAKMFVYVVTVQELDRKEKRGNPNCDNWWKMYGAGGYDHADLLLRQ